MNILWINANLLILYMRSFYIFITISMLFGTPEYPIDTLLASDSLPLIKKAGMIPIAVWQRLSYNTELLNCQFYPSCSNYGADAIKKYGLLRGSVLASERIVRCSPFALHYHMKAREPFRAFDGRLIDYVIPGSSAKNNKSPWIASFLSSIVPGLGRIYAGRTWDGIMGMWTIYLAGSATYYSQKENRPIATPIFGIGTLIIYIGEIYGSWRAAKYYKPK